MKKWIVCFFRCRLSIIAECSCSGFSLMQVNIQSCTCYEQWGLTTKYCTRLFVHRWNRQPKNKFMSEQKIRKEICLAKIIIISINKSPNPKQTMSHILCLKKIYLKKRCLGINMHQTTHMSQTNTNKICLTKEGLNKYVSNICLGLKHVLFQKRCPKIKNPIW